ncbi:LysR family transcriptional regulator, partial [Epibacterium ulvae]|uniref:LysR family transcriptional regulator n=1 Tax=Epibacterium ulvae TaxID=1156985 RepID=UPI001BFC42AB
MGHSIAEYEAFRALIQAGTATAAAAQLGVSQSAISRSIASLETRQGRLFFERIAGRLQPTQEALVLNRRLDSLFDALDLIDGPSEPVSETLRLIAPPSFAQRFLVSHINRFLQINPHYYVSFEVSTNDDAVTGILDGRFDLAICGVDASRAGVKLMSYRSVTAVCAMSLDHPFATRSEISPADLDGQNLIALTRRHVRRGQLDRLLNQEQAKPNVVAEVSTSYAAADLAREGMGIAVINPFPLYHYRSREMAFVRFNSPIGYKVHFAVSSQQPVPRIAHAFMRHVRLNTPSDPF